MRQRLLTPWEEIVLRDLRAPLVGRDAELARLRAALERPASTGEPAVVAVVGAAGVGKTRLVHDLLATLTAEGSRLRVLRGSTRESTASYAVFARLLRARFGLVEGMDAEEARETVRAQVAAVLDDRRLDGVLHLLGRVLDMPFPDSPLTRALDGDVAQARGALAAVLRSFLEADAASRPLCLVLDDLHLAHADSLELLRRVAGALHGKIALLCLARPEIDARIEGWGSGPHEVRIDLAPLRDADADRLVRELLAPCGAPPAALVDAACGMARGNPLLLEQMVRIFHDTGVLEEQEPLAGSPRWNVHPERLASVRMPLTVEDAVAARIAALDPLDRELLEHAALMGGVFWRGGLVALARIGRTPAEAGLAAAEDDEQNIKRRLRDLVARDYVLRLPDSTFAGDVEYVFKHNLERERLAALVPPERARRAHQTLADWMESRPGVRSHEEQVASLARHRDLAGSRTRAAFSWLEAGDIARQRYASARAAEYYAKGLELLAERDAVRRIEALHHHGDVLGALGRTDAALAAFREMLALAWRLGLLAKQGAAHNRIGRLFRDVGKPQKARAHLEAGLARFEAAGDRAGVAASLDDLGKLAWIEGAYDKAVERIQRALDMRRAQGDPRAIALSLNNLGLVHQDSGRFKDALDAFESALAIRREIGDLPGVAVTLNNLGTIAQDQRDDKRALDLFQQALEVARDVGDRNRVAMVLANLGDSHQRLGHPEEAIRLLRQAEEHFEEAGDRPGQADALRALAEAWAARGDLDRAAPCIARAVALLDGLEAPVLLGTALRAQGTITAAAGLDGDGAERAHAAFRRSLEVLEAIGNQVEAARTMRAYGAFLRRLAVHEGNPRRTKEAADLDERAERVFAMLKISSYGVDPAAFYAR